MNKVKCVTFITSIAILIGATISTYPADISAQDSQPDMRDITTMELVKDMGIGINLGNTLESCGDWIAQWTDNSQKAYETAWGSPVITKEIIQGYADEGFGVLRIPVAWSNRMSDDGTYTIDKDIMERVTEIVDWTIDAGMYAIINIHWDNGWVNTFPETKEESMKRYTVMWEQISDNFKDYNDYLMFESQNEELGWDTLWNKWGGTEGKDESYALVNEINQVFVDTIRKSGGNNDERHLLISGYNTDISCTCDSYFKMPSDPADRCALSVHYYTPAGFAILTEDADWGKAMYSWGTDADYAELDNYLDMLEDTFIDKDIPVIIGEYGCPVENKDPDSIVKYLTAVCEGAFTRDICPVMWDVTDAQYDRTACKLKNDQIRTNFQKISGFDGSDNKNDNDTTTPGTDIPSTQKIYGDFNEDGKAELTDLTIFSLMLLGDTTFTDEQNAVADLNGDGNTDIADLAHFKQFISKDNVVLGPQK